MNNSQSHLSFITNLVLKYYWVLSIFQKPRIALQVRCIYVYVFTYRQPLDIKIVGFDCLPNIGYQLL